MKKFAVLGNPISHSKSPQIHEAFAKQFNIKLSYTKIFVPFDQLAETLREFQEQGGTGVNITVPFKEEAAQLMQTCTERATIAGAVNTVVLADQQWLGDNTDGIGLLRDLTQNNTINLTNKTILILGAGGATQGILQPLLQANPRKIVIANRSFDKAEKLTKKFSKFGHCVACRLDNLPSLAFDLIINATSASTKGETLHLPSHLAKNSICYDLAYGTIAQYFLTWAKQHHAKLCIDGLGILVEQAAEAFKLWHDVMPETKSVIDLLRQMDIKDK